MTLPDHIKKEQDRLRSEHFDDALYGFVDYDPFDEWDYGFTAAWALAEKEHDKLKRENEVLREGLKVISTGIVQSEKSAPLAGFNYRDSAQMTLSEADKIRGEK